MFKIDFAVYVPELKVYGDVIGFDFLEEAVAGFADEDFLFAELLLVELREGFVAAEEFVD